MREELEAKVVEALSSLMEAWAEVRAAVESGSISLEEFQAMSADMMATIIEGLQPDDQPEAVDLAQWLMHNDEPSFQVTPQWGSPAKSTESDDENPYA